MAFPAARTRIFIARLAGDIAGASAVEDGIMLGIVGTLLFFAFHGALLDLCRAFAQFLGQP
jgi:hypothetical protein